MFTGFRAQLLLALLILHGSKTGPGDPVETATSLHARIQDAPQRTQYPLIKEYTLNYRGLNTMI